MCIPGHSLWPPNYIDVAQTVLVTVKMAVLFLDKLWVGAYVYQSKDNQRFFTFVYRLTWLISTFLLNQKFSQIFSLALLKLIWVSPFLSLFFPSKISLQLMGCSFKVTMTSYQKLKWWLTRTKEVFISNAIKTTWRNRVFLIKVKTAMFIKLLMVLEFLL